MIDDEDDGNEPGLTIGERLFFALAILGFAAISVLCLSVSQ